MRRFVLAGTLGLCLPLCVAAAVAWACNPQAHLTLEKSSYAPGETITVYGTYFPGNADITVTAPGESKTVTTSAGGAFSATFTAPSQAGTYVITATRPTGGAASVAFSVTGAPASPPPAPTTPTGPPAAPVLLATLTRREAVRGARAAVKAEFGAPARGLACRRRSRLRFACRARWRTVLRRYRGVIAVSRAGVPANPQLRYRIRARSRGALVPPRRHRSSGQIFAGQ